MHRWMSLLMLPLLLISACGSNTNDSTTRGSPSAQGDEPPPIEEIYAGLATTLQRDGIVLHSTRTTDAEVTGFLTSSVAIELWVDGPAAVARMEMSGSFEDVQQSVRHEGGARMIIRDASRYSSRYWITEDMGQEGAWHAVEAPGCYGQPEAIAIVIGCPGPTERSTTTVEWDERDGERVLVLVTKGTTEGSDEISEFVRRTYLDLDTFLPIFSEEEGTFDIGTIYPETAQTTYEHEFVECASLASDYFSLSAIGYSEPDMTARLHEHVETPVYWLGEHFDSGSNSSLPDLVLSVVQGGEQVPWTVSYEAIITYAPADNPHGPSAITIQIWPVENWDAGGAPAFAAGIGSQPCIAQEQIQLDDGKATVYRWIEGSEVTLSPPTLRPSPTVAADNACPEQGDAVRHTAIVRFAETVLLIDTPYSSSPRDGYHASPYNSAEGMRAVIEGLRRR